MIPVAAIIANENRKKYIAVKKHNADEISEKNRLLRTNSCLSDRLSENGKMNIQRQLVNNIGGSPEKAIINMSRQSSAFGPESSNLNDVIRLKEFEEDIPAQSWKEVYKGIGHLDTDALKFKALFTSKTASIGESSFVSHGTTASGTPGRHHGNTAVYDGWKDFLKQFVMYLFSPDIIFPDHPFKVFWDKMVLILLAYTAIEIPLHESFHVKFSVEFDTFVTVVFLFDIWLSFRTTTLCPIQNEYILDKKLIVKNYVTSWLFLDCIASLPLDEIAVIMHADKHIEEIFALFHLLRLLKLPRLLSGFSSFTHTMACCVLCIIFIMFSHWGACLFHLFGALHDDKGWLHEDDLYHQGPFERYVSAFYWAITTITTIGYGDIHAVTFDERLFSCFMVFVSAIVYSMVLGTMSLILGEMYHANAEHTMHGKKCKKYGNKLRYDSELLKRMKLVNDFEAEYEYQSSIEYLLKQSKFPNSIKYKILEKSFKPIIASNYAFKSMSENILLLLAERLTFSVCSPNEYLFKSKDITTKVYILQQGLVRVFHGETNQELCRLTNGSHFGEIPLFKQDQLQLKSEEQNTHPEFEEMYKSKCSPISVVSHTYCILYSIHYVDFKDILLINPPVYQLFETISEHRGKQVDRYDDQQLCEVCYDACRH